MLLSVSICVRLSVRQSVLLTALFPLSSEHTKFPLSTTDNKTLVRLPIVHIPLVVGGWLLLFLIIFHVAFLSSSNCV